MLLYGVIMDNSAKIIDNNEITMSSALISALSNTDRVDIEVAFFYFSGWQLLAESLKDKQVRILVGTYIDPDAIPGLLTRIKQEGDTVDLSPYQPRTGQTSYSAKKQTYVKGFIELSNQSALFDNTESQGAYKVLEEKVANGTLEIKLTSKKAHGKVYILHNESEVKDVNNNHGFVFMGSSNFTFQGLLNQEEVNEKLSDEGVYERHTDRFEKKWADAENVEIATKENKDEFLKNIKEKLWVYARPSPYAVYVRVLHELFSYEEERIIKTPGEITNNKYFDLEYQTEAIKIAIDKLNKYNGLILADVVGLGKSIIASAVAYNVGLPVIIIAPPHLKEQWEDYQAEFKLPGARVYSSGKIQEVYDKYKDSNEPILIIVDEAHRYRNEDINDYRLLHHICNSHKDNKIVLLTATPFNNNPKDIFALVKLFQIPGSSTIRSVDNLSLRFRELIDRYKKLNTARINGKLEKEGINKEADEIAGELRRLIENVIVRRSRLDLKRITTYAEDLKRQNIVFSEVKPPKLLSYDLGDLFDLYNKTLSKLVENGVENGFVGARYKPTTYIKEDKRKDFLKEYGEYFDDKDLQTAQTNLAKFMRRLLVARFESSKDAFRSTLLKMLDSTNIVEQWWDILGKVPIMKKGAIPDPDTLLNTTDDEVSDGIDEQLAEKEIEKLETTPGLIAIEKEMFKDEFIEKVRQDKRVLKEIYDDWFAKDCPPQNDFDPKLDTVKDKLEEFLKENKKRKIIIFSTYADTVNYLYAELEKRGVKRIFKYTAKDTGQSAKVIIRKDFDAGVPEKEQNNDYDILITTDALSEGYNLHRAGIIINYDIPYNPTRVIQRIGRINRINKRVFDELHIYNCFPTMIGEKHIRIKEISTLKMRLINAVIGSDTKTLTDDEKLESFFKEQLEDADKDAEQETWDAKYKEDYNNAKKDKGVFDEALQILPRSRIVRTNSENPAVIAFGKKGVDSIFAVKRATDQLPVITSAAEALEYFKATVDEQSTKADVQYDEVFKLVRNTLFAKPPLLPSLGRRGDAIGVIELIETTVPQAKGYCKDLHNIIKKYDAVNEGDLKRIIRLDMSNSEDAYNELREIMPEHQITTIMNRVEQQENEGETVVLSEDIRL